MATVLSGGRPPTLYCREGGINAQRKGAHGQEGSLKRALKKPSQKENTIFKGPVTPGLFIIQSDGPISPTPKFNLQKLKSWHFNALTVRVLILG